jgi:transketolase
MGDQVGVAVSGILYYVPFKEFERIRALSVSAVEKTSLFASFCRINTLYMIAHAGSGHIGSSFSSIDIMSWLLLNEVRVSSKGDTTSPCDIFFSSKGHDAPSLYNVFIGLGRLDFDLIHTLRKHGGLPGHPDISIPNIVTNTGSLGMGVSKAKGMIFANRLLKRPTNVFVLTGDGELQEGQFWESLISAANLKLSELTVIIDHNKLQSDTLVSKVSDLGDLEAKLTAFGWHVRRCDGNDLIAFSTTLAATKKVTDQPKVIIADTIKGKGVSFMEHTSIDSDVELYKFHSGAPNGENYTKATQQLIVGANEKLKCVGANQLKLETLTSEEVVSPEHTERQIPAYSDALLDQARNNSEIVALDADLVLDTGLIPFQEEFPDRFLECGIAEQDMVSQAGGIALQGLLPVVHSFACFLSTRPNEQIYNNATEGKKIIYVGSLAGILPAGPGHSHQSVRDIACMLAIPNMTIIEPINAKQIALVLNWAVNDSQESVYMRLTSIPYEQTPELSQISELIPGQGKCIRKGNDLIILCFGPILSFQAMQAAAILADNGIEATIVVTPWINRIDISWLGKTLGSLPLVVTLENHYTESGAGSYYAKSMANSGLLHNRKVLTLGLNELPVCGSNDEVLAFHGLRADMLASKIIQKYSSQLQPLES